MPQQVGSGSTSDRDNLSYLEDGDVFYNTETGQLQVRKNDGWTSLTKTITDTNAFKITSGDSVPTVDSNSKEGNIFYNTNTGKLRIREESAWQVTSKQSITDRAEFKTLYGASTPSVNTIQNVFYNTDTNKLQYLKNDAWRTVAEEEADEQFNVGVDSYKFSLNNAVQPELNLYRGNEYVFNQSSADNSGQRLFVSNDLSGRVVSAAAKYPKTALTSLNDNNYNVTSSTHYSAANIWTGFDYVTNPTPKTLYENTYTINTDPITISLNGVSGAITPVNEWANEFPILEISANDPNFFNTICEVSWSQSTQQNQHGGYYIQHDGIPQNAQTTAPGPMWWWWSGAGALDWRYNSYDSNTNMSTSSSYKLNNTVKFEFINNTSWKLTTNASGSTTAYTYTNSGFQGNVKIMYAFYESITSLHELIVKRQDTGTLHWWVGDSASGRDYDSNGDYIGNQSSFQTVGGEWIQIHFKNEIFILGSIKLYERPTTTEQATINQHLFAAKLPKDGIIFGSNDGSNWSQLCVFSNNDPSPRTININASTGYSYYTLLVTKTGGGAYGGNVNIAEIEFYSDSGLISSENTTGFTSTGTLGTDHVSTWTIPTDASDTMYYASDGSANAGGKINITDVPAQEKTFAVDVSLVQSQSGGTVVGLAGAGGLYTVGGSEYSSNPATIQINSGSHIFDGYYYTTSGWSPSNSSSFTAHQIWTGAMENIINNTIDSDGNTILSGAPEGGTIDQNTEEFSVIITFPVSVVINEYKMWHRGGANPSQPKAWTLRATDNLAGYEQNNDLTYTQLDDRDSITGWVDPGSGTPNVNNANSYTFTNTSAYKTYIINFTESNRTTHIALNELAYYGYVPSLENAFTLGGLVQPTLNLYRDSVYKFDQSDPDNVGQRLYVSNDLTLTENTAGVTSAGTLGTDLITTWRVPTDASDTMYYASDGSANMGGTISITDAPTKTTRVTTIASSAGSNGGGDTYTKYAVDVSLNRFTIGGHMQPTLNLYKDSIYKFDQSDPDNVGQRLFVSNDLSGRVVNELPNDVLLAGNGGLYTPGGSKNNATYQNNSNFNLNNSFINDRYADKSFDNGVSSYVSFSTAPGSNGIIDNASNEEMGIIIIFPNKVTINKYRIWPRINNATTDAARPKKWTLRAVNDINNYSLNDTNSYTLLHDPPEQSQNDWSNPPSNCLSTTPPTGFNEYSFTNSDAYTTYIMNFTKSNRPTHLLVTEIAYYGADGESSTSLSENTAGVTSTGTLGTDLVSMWRVPTDASDTMYYASDGSANAGGKINLEVTPYEEKTYAVDVSTINLGDIALAGGGGLLGTGGRIIGGAMIGENVALADQGITWVSSSSANYLAAGYQKYDPAHMFDNGLADQTGWHCGAEDGTSVACGFIFPNNSEVIVTKYRIWTIKGFKSNSPKAWELRGIKNGVTYDKTDSTTYTIIHNISNQSSWPYSGEPYPDVIDEYGEAGMIYDVQPINRDSYNMYVIHITEGNTALGNNSAIRIGEVAFYGLNMDIKYTLDGLAKPTLNLYRDSVYKFDQSDPENVGKQIYAYNTNNIKNTTGFTSTGTLGTDMVTRWRIPTDASDTMYYARDGDANAGGTINIFNSTTNNTMTPTVVCLTTSSAVNVISSGGNKYRFNGDTTYVANKYYGLGSGTFTFTGVPSAHPIAILNAGKTSLISYTGLEANKSSKTVSGTSSDGAYDFYHGDVTVTVSGDFGSVSVYCYLHGYMGGENLLRYSSTCTP